MPFNTGKQIGRYEIISLLGSGGMGEVYLAKDTQLKRQIALKVLKKTNDQSHLRRFRQEARTASALNHPNILSIYEFGEHEDFHFIVTELVKGDTLREIISGRKPDIREAVEFAVQIGNALVVAHRAGVTHRDIKPENIMILPDGYVKVLDFGLAKLNSAEDAVAKNLQDSTVSLIQTNPGLIIGTVNYMSPEQLRGQEVDGRSDIWSLGAVLYEMIAGYRPFTGESVSDVIAAILERPLPPLPATLPEIPPELEVIIAKALAKKKAERYPNTKDFVDDLKKFRQLLSGNFSSDLKKAKSSVTQANKHLSVPNALSVGSAFFEVGKRRMLGLFTVFILFFAGLGGWFYLPNSSTQIAVPQRTSKPLPVSGKVLNAVISPDGRFIVYVQDDAGKQSLRLKQVAENADSVLIPAEAAFYAGIQFSPDSNAVFYSIFKDSPTGQLFRKPILGGTPQKIAEDIDSSVSFSPDGKHFVFIRTKSHDAVDQLIISDIDGINMRTLAERSHPKRYSINVRESPAWSPDGKTIACAALTPEEEGEKMAVVEIDVATGFEKEVTSVRWFRIGKVLWAKDGLDLIITAADFGSTLYQILRLSRSTGQIEKITTELNDYLNISISADSGFLLAVADERSSNIYTASSTDPGRTTQIAGGSLEGLGGLVWTPDEKILYVSAASGNRDIWIMDGGGENPRQLTFDKTADDYPSISADGQKIAFVSLRTGFPHVWLMDIDGSNLQQITDRGGEAYPQITPDGNWVIYSINPLKIWRVATQGGEPKKVTDTAANWVTVSPDGSKIAGLTMSPGMPMRLSVFSAENGTILETFDLIGEAGTPSFPPILRWTADGQAVGYISTENGVSNIIVQPLKNKKARKITDFSADRIFAFDWSKDGGKIAFARGTARNKLLLFENF